MKGRCHTELWKESGHAVSAQGILDIVGSKGILKKRNIADNSMKGTCQLYKHS